MIELGVKLVEVVIRSCLVKIFAVFVSKSSVWPAVRVCKAVVFGSSVSSLSSNAVNSVSTFPTFGIETEVWISTLPFTNKLLLIVPPDFCKYRLSKSSTSILELYWEVGLKYPVVSK